MTRDINNSNSSNSSSGSNSNSINNINNNSIINIPTPFETSLERIDLVPLKRQLDAVLKDRSEDYWEWIRKYLCGRLSKRELDYYVTTNLNEGNLHLHNTFFKAVIFNAFYSKTSPTIIEQKAKKKQSSSTSTKDKKDKRDSSNLNSSTSSTSSLSSAAANASNTTSTATSSTPSKRKKEKDPKNPSSSKRQRRERNASSLSSSTSNLLSTLTKSKQKKKLFPKYSLFSSQLQTLKNKMEEIANENGLTGISKQSIIYMQLALEQHIINLLNKTKPHILPTSLSNLTPMINQLPPPSYIDCFFNDNLMDDNNDSNDNNNTNNSDNINNNVNNNQQDTSIISNIEIAKDDNSDSNIIPEQQQQQQSPDINMADEITTTTTTTSNLTPPTTTIINNQNTPPPPPPPPPTTFSFNNIFNFNNFKKEQQQNNDKLNLNYPKYVESHNPLLSQSISFYKIPENIFSNEPSHPTYLSTQDIYTMVEDNNLFLGNDPLAFERINLLRY